jgi:DNA-binding transcriptional regulator YdaS (Cro superfamily)
MEHLRAYLKAERGRTSRLAEALDLFPGAITQWKGVPAKHVLGIERATGISRHDLRPDLYPREVAA